MDSDDLSFIEIAGEDDSLLQPIPRDGVSGLGAGRSGDYFMCSPLHLPRSHAKPTGGMAANEDLEDMKNSFYRDSVNKENLNIDKAEMVKLGIEPQQMKRKKKGGGYNLRKSLAWDRAFFTEEGVLDPMELSMISGSFSKSKGETLSAIQEEDSNCDSNSLDMQALEVNLFKKLPVTTSEIMNNGGSLLPKKRNNEAPTSMATRKVLSAHNVNRTGSKRNACPQPLASSSLKRPANLVTTTTSAKDSKVSKVPVQKTNPPAPTRIAKSSTLGATDSKHITRPVNVQKNSGLKGSSNNAKNVVNSSKAGPAGKSLPTKTFLRQAKRTVLPLNKKASGDFEVTPNPPLPSTQFAPNIHHDVSSKSAVSLPKTSSHTGVSMQHTQLQTAKPSGLRMPSPSLGFFGQSKAPPLQNPLRRTSQPSNLPESVKSNLRKFGAPPNPVSGPRPPLAPGSLPEVIHDGAKTGNIKASCASLVCTVPSAIDLALDEIVESVSQASNLQKMEQKVHYNDNVESDSQVPSAIKLGAPNPVFEPRPQLASRSLLEVIIDGANMENNKTSVSSSGSSVPSAIKPVSYEIVEPDSQISNLQKMEQKVLYNDDVSEAMKSEKELHSTLVSMDHQILGQAGQCMGKSTSPMEDEINQRNDDNFLQTETLQGADKHGSDMKVFDGSMTSNKGGELECPELTSQSISAMEVTALSVKSDINDHLLVEDKPSYFSIEHGISSKINVGKCNDSEQFGEQAKMMNALSCEASPISSSQMLQDNVANINPEVQDYNVSETGKSDASSHLRSTEQENVDTNALDKVKAQLNFEDAGMQLLDGNTPVKSSESYISTLLNNQTEVVVSDVTEKTEYLEFQNSLLTREDALQDGVMLHVNDCSFGEKNFFLEESKQENSIKSDEPEVTDACESEMNCPMPVSKQDSGSDTAKLVECQNQEDIPPVSVDSKPSVENYNLDAQFQHDVGLHDHCSTMELGNMDEDYLTDAVSAESEHLGESRREVTYFTCEPSLIVQVEGNSWTSHTDEHDDAEDRKINLSAESSCRNSNSLPEDKFSLDHDNSSMGQIFVLRGEIDVSNHQENEDKQVMPCFPEGDRISYEEKQSPEAQCFSLEHSHSREEPQKSKDGNSADVKLEVSVHDGSGLESPGLSLHEQTDQALKESEIVNCMIGEPGNSELQDPVNLIEEVFPISVTGVGLNHVSLANNSAEVFNGENDFENVLEECNEAPIVQVDDLDVNKNGKSLEVAVTSSFEIAPSVKNVQRTTGIDCMIGERDGNSELLDLVNQIEEVFPESVIGNSAEVFTEENNVENVLEERNEATIVQVDGLDVNKSAEPLEVEVAMTSSLEIAPSVENTHCATRCRHENEPSNEANSPKSHHCRSVSNSQISVNCTLDIEQQHELENTLSTEDKDVTKDDKKSGIEKKQDILVVKPPPYAAPFSDEWLAAFEAAGEEILTMKSGAVQNSPEDRSQSEPGPWSPVKRKHNQAIGPFDCTKYTNTNQ